MRNLGVGSDNPIYRGMDRQALDAAYDNSAAVKDSACILKEWTERSDVFRKRKSAVLDIRYGLSERNSIDYLPAPGSENALFVFIHGGYWQRNSKEMFAFVSEGLHARGINVALVGYTLAPEANMTRIVGEIDAALKKLVGEADQLGFDRSAIIVGGWSAGGHLAALACRNPFAKAAVTISGIFDLEPIRLCYLNGALDLTRQEVQSFSPARLISDVCAPTHIFVGEDELPELRRQSAEYQDKRQTGGLKTRFTLLSDKDHFSILEDFTNPESMLCKGVSELAQGLVAK